MNTNIDYRETVKTVDLFTLGIARDRSRSERGNGNRPPYR